MLVNVEIPRFDIRELVPESTRIVHPAFIGPDGTVLDSIIVEMEDWMALPILRMISYSLWEWERDYRCNYFGSLFTEEYTRVMNQLYMLGKQINKLS